MEQSVIEKHLFETDYIDHAFQRYYDFKKTSTYDETYKLEILSKLNSYMQQIEISKENIVDIIKKLKDSNPQEGSFVHWSNTSDLLDYASAEPEEVATLLMDLYQNDNSIQERIDEFRNKGKEYNSKISLGAPLFGYLLAAYDYKEFPLYKEEVFKDIKRSFGINTKLSSVSENYQNFYDICRAVLRHLTTNGFNITMLDVQDFFFCITQYDQPKVESAVDYIYSIATKLARFKKNDQEFLDEIKKLDKSYLEKKRDSYRNPIKVNKICYRIIDHYLVHNKINLSDLERIKAEVSSEYEKNILKSWKNFTILFLIYFDSIKAKVRHELINIHQAIRNIDGAADLDLHVDSSLNDFSWKQNFGDTESWLAVYPAEKESHKIAAQLFLSINEEKIRFGLLYGSEHPQRGEGNITTIKSAREFTYPQMVDKFTEVLPQFMEGNQLDMPTGKTTLSATFSSVFNSFEEADQAFNLVNQTLGKLDITEPDDSRVAVTFPSSQKIHIDYCSWLIIGFQKDTNNETFIRVAMLED